MVSIVVASIRIVILQEPKPWVLRLLAISCVSLAAKMKSEFSLVDFQVNLQANVAYMNNF